MTSRDNARNNKRKEQIIVMYSDAFFKYVVGSTLGLDCPKRECQSQAAA